MKTKSGRKLTKQGQVSRTSSPHPKQHEKKGIQTRKKHEKIVVSTNYRRQFKKRSEELLIMLLLLSFKLSCGLMKGESESKHVSSTLTQPYSGDVGAGKQFTFSNSGVIASKAVRGQGVNSHQDAKKALFLNGGLYKLLTLRCTPCHAGRNDYPFASPGADLAWVSIKSYLVSPVENSKIIRQIQIGHSGALPAWEADFLPLMKALNQ